MRKGNEMDTRENMSMFEAVIFALLQLKEKYGLEFEIWTNPNGRIGKDSNVEIGVQLREKKYDRICYNFTVTKYMLEQPGFLDTLLERAVESFQ